VAVRRRRLLLLIWTAGTVPLPLLDLQVGTRHAAVPLRLTWGADLRLQGVVNEEVLDPLVAVTAVVLIVLILVDPLRRGTMVGTAQVREGHGRCIIMAVADFHRT
jgi:hypothetical protein